MSRDMSGRGETEDRRRASTVVRARGEAEAAAPLAVVLLTGASPRGGVPPFSFRGEARVLPLDRPIAAGRGESCDMVLDDPAASREHVRLAPRDGGARIEDLGSRNGTFVDGRPIASQPLDALPGAIVRAGDSILCLYATTEPFAAASAAGPLVGGPSLAPVRRAIGLVGPTDLRVLVSGETGTGKEIVARALHGAAPRSGPFVAVNCAALPEALAESELFGHVRGAFTGADRARRGLFSAAAGGTLFLDEVGELGPGVQAKLLRVIEDGEVRPLGAEKGVRVGVRVIAATNRDLARTIAPLAAGDGAFRADLLARLAEVEIRLPPLRERLEDLPALADHLLRRAGAATVAFEPDALEALLLHAWPQNVRELDAVLRSAALSGAERIALADLPPRIADAWRARRASGATPEPDDPRARIERALSEHRGNVRQTCLAVGLSRAHIYRLFRQWGVDPQAFRAGTRVAGPAGRDSRAG